MQYFLYQYFLVQPWKVIITYEFLALRNLYFYSFWQICDSIMASQCSEIYIFFCLVLILLVKLSHLPPGNHTKAQCNHCPRVISRGKDGVSKAKCTNSGMEQHLRLKHPAVWDTCVLRDRARFWTLLLVFLFLFFLPFLIWTPTLTPSQSSGSMLTRPSCSMSGRRMNLRQARSRSLISGLRNRGRISSIW